MNDHGISFGTGTTIRRSTTAVEVLVDSRSGVPDVVPASVVHRSLMVIMQIGERTSTQGDAEDTAGCDL